MLLVFNIQNTGRVSFSISCHSAVHAVIHAAMITTNSSFRSCLGLRSRAVEHCSGQ